MELSPKIFFFGGDVELKAFFGKAAKYQSHSRLPSQMELLGLLSILDLSAKNISAFGLLIYVNMDWQISANEVIDPS